MKGLKITALLAVCFVTFFVNNKVLVPDIMESRNIITVREMVYDGHWILPMMNGEPRLEKPPLPTWLTAVAELVSPDNLALQRGVAGCAALLLVFYFWLFARKVIGVDSVVAVLLLCTCYSVILMGRTASWDIYTHAFMMGGIYHFARGLNGGSRVWLNFVASGIYIGLSVMSKGPVSLYALFLPFLISWSIFGSGTFKGKWGAIAVMIVVALVIGTWWYIYVYVLQSDALVYVAQKESSSWINHNVRPWWYYWKFFLESGVWSLLLLTAIFLPVFKKQARQVNGWRFSLAWLLLVLLLLSFLPEKKTRYLFPLLIPACYLMSSLIMYWKLVFKNRITASPADVWGFRSNVWLIIVAMGLLPFAAWKFLFVQGYISFCLWLSFTVLTIILICILFYSASRLRPVALVASVVVLFLFAESFMMPAVGKVVNNPQMKSIAATAEMDLLRGIPFYHLDSEPLRIELVYAAHRKIRPISIDSIRKALPCALLTHSPVQNALPACALEGMDVQEVGLFDDNRRPRGNRRYGAEFIYYVTLLNEKTDSVN